VSSPDAVIVGSGPNGLAAAVTLARAGLAVEVFEGADIAGGGCRTSELTLPGYAHDVCSSVHPLAAASPFFRSFAPGTIPLRTPEIAFAHPLDGGRAAAVFGSVADTAAALGADAKTYRRLLGPLVKHAEAIVPASLGPVRPLPPPSLAMTRFGALGALPTTVLAKRFQTAEARALLAGAAAHSMRPLNAPLTSAFALLMTVLAHSVGWPVIEGGSATLVDVLLAELDGHGGIVHTDEWVESLADLPSARSTLLDVTPRQLLAIDDGRLPGRYRRALGHYRYGPGIWKVDWALSGPDVNAGRHPERPFCIVVQPSVIDPTRAPAGKQTLWAYCHVPNGSTVDMTERIEDQIERFAPGFRDLVLARSTTSPAQAEAHNPNYVGGDIGAGAATLRQTLFRPTFAARSYRTPVSGLYLCSASTPPGGGVHGMCGDNAARVALRAL